MKITAQLCPVFLQIYLSHYLKTIQDPRHIKREQKFSKLFSYSFSSTQNLPSEEINIDPIIDKLSQIDDYIEEAAPEWPVNRLNRVDLAILRLAIYELLIDKSTPPKVVIDEAVEIGKTYGSESTAKFVNGVLGTLLKKRPEEEINQNN